MELSKLLGIIILFIGLSIIFWGIYQVFKVYSQVINPPSFFKPISHTKEGSLNLSEGDLNSQMRSVMQEQLNKILPSNYITELLNYITFSILIGIFIFAGYRISIIGVKLISAPSESSS
ncbi:hypothetical protein J7J12_03330 [bacterium]|nr:hypothetical protein [bacterium]